MKRLMCALIAIVCLAGVATADEATLEVTKDTDIWSVDPDGNGGDWKWFDLRGGIDTEERARSLVAFDLSPIMGMTVNMSILRLYAIETEWGMSGGHAEIYRAADSWDEMTVTWNNQPAENKDIRYVHTLPDPIGTWAQLEVTDIVQSWANESFENHGFFLAVPEGTPEAFISFASKDTSDAELHPQLYVMYSTGSVEEAPVTVAALDVSTLSIGAVSIIYTVPSPTYVTLAVYDASGARVETLTEGFHQGSRHFTWNPDNRGVYFVRLATEEGVYVKRAVVLD